MSGFNPRRGAILANILVAAGGSRRLTHVNRHRTPRIYMRSPWCGLLSAHGDRQTIAVGFFRLHDMTSQKADTMETVYKAIAAVQAQTETIAVIIDMAKRFDPVAARDAGCELDTILVSQAETDNAAAEIVATIAAADVSPVFFFI
jgi:hypothetical protein